MKLDLTDKVILVAGNSKELKDSIRKTLAEEGATSLFIIGRESTDNLQMEPAQADGTYVFHFVPGHDPSESIRMGIEKVLSKYGRIDGLVILPDLMDESEITNVGSETFPASIPHSLAYAYLLVLNTLPALKESKGALVNICRELPSSGQDDTSDKTALSGGQAALTREWAVELLKYSIRVNAVLIRDSGENSQENSGDISSVVVFLMSGKSSHTTGQLIYAGK